MIDKKFNFTKEKLDNLPIPKERDTYHDAKTPGLQIRHTRNGNKSFSVYKRIKGGQPVRVTLGKYPQLSIEQARLEAAKINLSIETRENPAEVRRAHKAEISFKELFNEYITRHSKPKKRTWNEDVQKYEKYLASTLGKLKVTAISRKEIGEIHSKITLSGHPITANRVLALVSSVFGRAIEWSIVENNPAIGIKRNKENKRERFVQSNELPLFFRALASEENDTVRDIFLLALLTGARRENIISMKWRDLSFERAEWFIERTKNDESQTITLSQEAIEVLKNRKPRTFKTYVFEGDGKLGYFRNPEKGWLRLKARAKALGFIEAIAKEINWSSSEAEEMIKKAITEPDEAISINMELGTSIGISPEHFNIDDLRIHDLRRTLGSWQAKSGASLVMIGKSLNHKSVQTTAIYARLDKEPVRASVELATNAILQAAGLKKGEEIVPAKKGI
jgi:integrase